MRSQPTQSRAGLAVAAAAVMIAQLVAGKATRDALFLSSFGAHELLQAMVGSAMLSLLGALLMAGGLNRMGPNRLVPLVFLAHAGLFGLESWLHAVRPSTAAALLYLHLGALGATVISGFWSVVSERFDPHAAKRAFGSIGAGATAGGVAGGLLAERVSGSLGVASMLPILAALNLLCALLVNALGRSSNSPTHTRHPLSFAQTMGALSKTALLRKIAALVVLTSITAAIFDFTVKTEADATFHSPEDLGRFFALFYTGVNVLTFIVQTGLASRVLRRLGIGAAIGLLPASVLLAAVLGAVVQKLWSAAVAAGTEGVLRSSIYRSAYELLYTPMAPATKRPTKALIDVAFDRLGDALGAGLLMGVMAILPLHAKPVVLALAGLAALVALLVSLRLHQDYVSELARSLQSGVVRLERDEVFDATTMRTLVDTATGVNRGDLLRQIQELKDQQQQTRQRASHPPTVPSASLLKQIAALSTADRAIMTAVVDNSSQTAPLHPALIALAIPLIGDPQLSQPTLAALDHAAPDAAGQLGDVMLNPRTALPLRVRLAHVLGRSATARARDALMIALADSDFDLRYHAGQALLRLTDRDPSLAPPKEQLFAAVRVDLDASVEAWTARRVTLLDDPPVFVDTAFHARAVHSLEHVLSVLAIALDRKPLNMCLIALLSDDPASRGTALEYLQNVVPAEIYRGLRQKLPRGQVTPPVEPARREQRHIIADLFKSVGGK